MKTEVSILSSYVMEPPTIRCLQSVSTVIETKHKLLNCCQGRENAIMEHIELEGHYGIKTQ